MEISRKRIVLPIVAALALVVLLWLATVALAEPVAQRLGLGGEAETAAAGMVPSRIFYQGRLADGTGDPITGTYVMTFSLYTALTDGALLDQDSHTVFVNNGLFRTYLDFGAHHYNGQALFVGVQVEGDAEMEPRHYLRPVPYALSLRPGALISGEVAAAQPALMVVNTGTGNAIRGYKDGSGAAVAGVNDGTGAGGYFSSAGDYALYVDGDLFVNGSVWSKSYRYVVVVAKGRGGDYSSIQSALDSITDAAEDNPYLVRVMPGIYEEQVTLKSYVTVQGSGWRLTVISDTASPVVEGAHNASLSNLRVINTNATGDGRAIRNDSVLNVSIEGVVAQTSGATTGYGMYNTDSSVEIRSSIITAGESDDNYGLYASNSRVDIEDSLISASGGSVVHKLVYGIYSTGGSRVTIQGSTVRASGAITQTDVYGIYNYTKDTILTANDTTIEVEGLDGGSGTIGVTSIHGVYNTSHAVATLEDCTVRATGAVTSTDWVVGARNTSTSTLKLRRTVIYANDAEGNTNGIYGVSWAETSLWFSEVYADSSDGAVKGIDSYRGSPFDLNYSTISATGGGPGAGEEAYGLYTYQQDTGTATEVLIREGKVSGDDYAIGNDDDNTDYTIKVFETWLEGAVDEDDTYICLGAHDGTDYLGADCQAMP